MPWGVSKIRMWIHVERKVGLSLRFHPELASSSHLPSEEPQPDHCEILSYNPRAAKLFFLGLQEASDGSEKVKRKFTEQRKFTDQTRGDVISRTGCVLVDQMSGTRNKEPRLFK